MEPFIPNAEGRPCECGGRVAFTPSLKLKHENTRKHREWLFRKLSWEFLNLTTLPEKWEALKVMKAVAFP
jgi:hypothetical protein